MPLLTEILASKEFKEFIEICREDFERRAKKVMDDCKKEKDVSRETKGGFMEERTNQSLGSFRHECEILLRRIVHSWFDSNMNPYAGHEGLWTKEWWDHEMEMAQEHLKREKKDD